MAVVRGPHAVGSKYLKEVHGVTAAIDIVIETGDRPSRLSASNLPTTQGIREKYGRQVVSLSNGNEAYDKSTLPSSGRNSRERRRSRARDENGARSRAK